MSHVGQELKGPGGYRLRFDVVEPERLVLEAVYGEAAALPPAHWHPSQEEGFEVVSGVLRTVIGEVERRYVAGERFEIPPGTVHTMAGEPGTRLRWEVAPALRTAEFLERLYGGDPALQRTLIEDFDAEIRFTAAPRPARG